MAVSCHCIVVILSSLQKMMGALVLPVCTVAIIDLPFHRGSYKLSRMDPFLFLNWKGRKIQQSNLFSTVFISGKKKRKEGKDASNTFRSLPVRVKPDKSHK